MTGLILATAIGMSLFHVAQSAFTGNHAVVCIGLARGVVPHLRHRLYFVKDVGVKRPKLDSVIRKLLIHSVHVTVFYVANTPPSPRKQPYKPSAEDLERLEQRLKQTSLSA